MKEPFPDNYVKLIAAVQMWFDADSTTERYQASKTLRHRLDLAKQDLAAYAAEAMQPPQDT